MSRRLDFQIQHFVREGTCPDGGPPACTAVEGLFDE